MPVVLRSAALAPRDRMCIVKADKSLAIRPVQRERVVDAVRLRRRHWHPRHREPNPVAALRVNDENLPIEIEKHIEGRVARHDRE